MAIIKEKGNSKYCWGVKKGNLYILSVGKQINITFREKAGWSLNHKSPISVSKTTSYESQ